MNRKTWNTISQESKIEYEAKKSVFIALAKPIHSQEDADSFLRSVRVSYPDAGHHVYAWRVCSDMLLQKYSDDGEPGGTAGLPVLEVLTKNEIGDAIIVVTRYFGGTLLGTGGLVRAYGRSALMALELAVPVVCRICELYEVMISYPYLDKLLFVLKKAGYIIKSSEYGLDPILVVGCLFGEKEDMIRLCTDVTSGQAIVEFIGEETLYTERTGDLRFE